MKLFNIKNNKGFTVLFSVIVSSIVLAIGISIANITLKQIIISSAGRESQIAFYAADSGAECAIYHDLMFPENKIFPESQSVQGADIVNNVKCFGQPVTVVAEKTSFDLHNATTTFRATFPAPNNYCAEITVSKFDEGDGFVDKTIIDSRGYNICPGATVNPRTLERGLQIVY